MVSLALKLLLTPALIGAASLAGRRWGPAISGWLVGLPFTSCPVVFFVALNQGTAVTSLTNGATIALASGANVPSVLETPVAVDKTNIADTVLKDGYVTKDAICQGVPPGTDGIC